MLALALRAIYLLLCVIVQAETVDYGLEFYNIALRLYNISARNLSFSKLPSKIHLIRVPKASSSSLSTIARRIVGCEPYGQCCKYPGTPVGSCASKMLFECQLQGKVVGCTHHYPNYKELVDVNIFTMSMMRLPLNRSVSAFFYPGIHHNSNCKKSQDMCFIEYTKNEQWQNIAVKLLIGEYAYANIPIKSDKQLQLAISNLMKYVNFMGISEIWALSLLLLHQKLPFLKPLKDEFLMYDQTYTNNAPIGDRIISEFDSTNDHKGLYNLKVMKQLSQSNRTSVIKSNKYNRMNENQDYTSFKKTAFEKYKTYLQNQNKYDLILYDKVIEKLCHELRIYNLWNINIVQDYWKIKMIKNDCSKLY